MCKFIWTRSGKNQQKRANVDLPRYIQGTLKKCYLQFYKLPDITINIIVYDVNKSTISLNCLHILLKILTPHKSKKVIYEINKN